MAALPAPDAPRASRFPGAGTGVWGFLLLLLAALLVMFPEVFFGTHTFFHRDYALFAYPLAYHHSECFWNGEIPLWNPLSNCGLPHLAQWNTLTLYPLSAIYLLFPLPWSLGFFCLAHLVLGGLGMFYLTRRWTNNNLAATMAGTAYALNGFTLYALMLPNYTATLAWMPWVILWGQRACNEGGRALLVAALLGALQWLAGAPEFIVFTWFILGVLVVVEAIKPSGQSGVFLLKPVLRLGLMGLVVVALTAAQILPFLELLKHSHRDVNYDTNVYAMPIWGWANLLVPLFHETPSKAGIYSQLEQQWTYSYYLGIATLVLAIIPIGWIRQRRIWALAGLTLFSLWMALGVDAGLYAGLKAVFPQLGMIRYPVKYVVIAVFTVPVLSAYGLQAVLTGGRTLWPRIGWVLASLALLIGIIVIISWQSPKPDENATTTMLSGFSRGGLLAIFFILLWLLNRNPNLNPNLNPPESEIRTNPEKPVPDVAQFTIYNLQLKIPIGILTLALAAIMAVDFLSHTPRLNPTVTVDVYAPEAGLFEAKPKAGESRACISPWINRLMTQYTITDAQIYCLGNRRLMYCNWNVLDRIPKVNGFYSLYPREHAQILELIYGSTNRPAEPLLDFLGVTQFTVDSNLFALEYRATAMPLVTIGQKPVFATEKETLQRMGGMEFQPKAEVFLPAELSSHLAAQADTQARIKLTRFSDHQLIMETEAGSPALAVIAQTWYPNWRATVDGQPADLLRANHAFQAVAVPAGRHELRLVYDDRSFKLGAVISLVTLVGCLLAWIILKRVTDAKPAIH